MTRVAALRQQLPLNRVKAEAQSYTIPAPVGGLNSRDALAAMPETDALVLDNLFAQPSWVEIRGGRTKLGSFTGDCQTLAAYNSLSGTNQLFAAVNNANSTYKIFRVDNAGGGAGTAVVTGLSSATLDYTQFGTGAAEVLYMVNGLDAPNLYDGTTWYAITTSSTPYALTGGPTPLSGLSQVVRYKSRLWFAQGGTFNIYFLPQNVFAGALTLLNIGPNFNLGGSLAMMVSVSIDNAAGINDYMAFVSMVGEVVVFQGFDPNFTSTWFEAAHFRIGRPLATGKRGWQKVGSDAVIACVDGVVPLSKALLTDRSQESIAITDKIRYDFNTDANIYAANFGWQVLLYPFGTKILINVPVSGTGGGTLPVSYQYVQNTLSGAWSTFNKRTDGWGVQCMETMGDKFYIGARGWVYQADVPLNNDSGVSIPTTAKPAFSYLGNRQQLKQFTQCQPIFQVNGTLIVGISVTVDFDLTAMPQSVPISNNANAVWGTSLWSTPTFWGDAQTVVKRWIGMNAVGYSMSMQMQLNANNIQARWQSTNYLFKPGSQFYG